MPPFNTAMLNGFNTVFGANKKLGSWPAYLEMQLTPGEDGARSRL